MLTRRFLTVKEVADLVQVSEASVRHWIKLQQLRAIDLGREWRVIPRDLEAFLTMQATCRMSSGRVDAGGAPSPALASGGAVLARPMEGPLQPSAARHSQPSGAAARRATTPRVTPARIAAP